MASEYSIKMDYARAQAAAAKLDEVADGIKHMMDQEYPDIMGDVRYNWRGDNADQFQNKGEVLRDKMLTVEKNLRETADTIRRIAKNTYDAEMRALEIARAREFDH